MKVREGGRASKGGKQIKSKRISRKTENRKKQGDNRNCIRGNLPSEDEMQ
jgi:hypothetical protein